MGKSNNREFSWFLSSQSKVKRVLSFENSEGAIRSLGKTKAIFSSPITCIAGKNGSGKTTILQLIACNFSLSEHRDMPYTPQGKIDGKYQLKDFFVFAKTETRNNEPISYAITYVDSKGAERQLKKRRNKIGTRWNSYDRIDMDVSYLSTARVLPTTDDRTAVSRRRRYSDVQLDENISGQIKDYMNEIFGTAHSSVVLREANSKRKKSFLWSVSDSPVSSNDNRKIHSNFNLGAGENSVLDILGTILTMPSQSLLLIDEIELGLHARAQQKLMRVLYKIAGNKKCQIICTTHSRVILDSVSPESRMLVTHENGETKIIKEFPPQYAEAELSGTLPPDGLKIFVEDRVCKTIVENSLDTKLRKICGIYPMGGVDGSLPISGAVHIKEKNYNFLILSDGDKPIEDTFSKMKNALGDCKLAPEIDDEYIRKHISKLPGNSCPEEEIRTAFLSDNPQFNPIEELAKQLGYEDITSLDTLFRGFSDNPHNLFKAIADLTSRSIERAMEDTIEIYCKLAKDDLSKCINDRVNGLLRIKKQ